MKYIDIPLQHINDRVLTRMRRRVTRKQVETLLDKIADTENIDVTDEEIDAEIESLASASRQTKEQVRAALTKNGGERSIAHRLRNRKALDLLIANASVTEEEWSDS